MGLNSLQKSNMNPDEDCAELLISMNIMLLIEMMHLIRKEEFLVTVCV